MRLKNKAHPPYSLKKQLIYLVTFGYLIIIVLLMVLDYTSITTYQRQIRQSDQEGFSDYVSYISSAMDAIEKIFYDLCINNEEFSSLAADEFDDLEGMDPDVARYGTAYELNQQMQSKMMMYSNIESLAIFYNAGSQRWYTPRADMDSELMSALIGKTQDMISSSGYQNRWNLINEGDRFYYMKLYVRQNAAFAGYIALNDLESQLNTWFRKKPEIVITLNDQPVVENLLWHQVSQDYESGESFQSMKGYVMYSFRLGSDNLKIHLILKQNLWDRMNILQIILLIGTGLTFLLIIFIFIFLRRQLLYPLNRLMHAMEEVRGGHWEQPELDEMPVLEYQQLNETFKMMLSEIRQLKIDSYEEKLARQKAQMQYLQLQLKPHFFLNCLKTMNALVMNGKYDKIQDLIFNISKHMRFILNSEKQLVPLSAEMAYVYNFLELQKSISLIHVRLCEQIGDEVRDCLVPSLAIQTFVENSCKYARLSDANDCLIIEVKAMLLKAEGESFVDICIKDNGSGYPAGLLQALNDGTLKPSHGSNIGIANLRKRCTLLYGGRAEYMFENQGGAVSELILPCYREE